MKRYVILFGIILSAIFAGQSQVALAQQDPFEYVCSGDASNSTACENRPSADENPLLGPDGIITRVIQILTIIIGVASVIVIIVGGLQYILSAGEAQKTAKAKDTILYAVIGLVVAVFAQAIISFVLTRL